jgi:hypothetical protein
MIAERGWDKHPRSIRLTVGQALANRACDSTTFCGIANRCLFLCQPVHVRRVHGSDLYVKGQASWHAMSERSRSRITAINGMGNPQRCRCRRHGGVQIKKSPSAKSLIRNHNTVSGYPMASIESSTLMSASSWNFTNQHYKPEGIRP